MVPVPLWLARDLIGWLAAGSRVASLPREAVTQILEHFGDSGVELVGVGVGMGVGWWGGGGGVRKRRAE